ncbi:MAG: serine--tRNA ligase [Planctomycetes bacterium]|jgi:seryl-tRNA synthetase|nr:serine--tRNA ligase [Planctomycetota bacterium]MDP6423274.1 serine--tRNA ligase [Planctomycetota bacterium]
MLDPKWVREHPDVVKEAGRKKHLPCEAVVDEFVRLDAELREVLPHVEGLRAEQKASGKSGDRERLKELKGQIQDLTERQRQLMERRELLALQLPNIPAAEVPDGETDADNVEIRRWGEVRTFDFEPKSHIELGEALDMIDAPRGVKIAGSRHYFLKNDAVRLVEALMSFALEHMIAKGFTPMEVPLLVRDPAMFGTAYFPGGEEQTYRCEKDELSLVGTAEVPLTAYHSDEILSLAELPKRYVARSVCFRREAGTYGKDTKGLYRVHQFQKVEQVIVDRADPVLSLEHHLEITKNSEEILQALELPYRVVNVCGGDLGQPQIQKFDIETWMPSRDSYGETHSASRFHDFQSRRLKLRYRDEDGKTRFCHTLNNTVAASTRLVLAILENHQEPDGSIAYPEPLRKYMCR